MPHIFISYRRADSAAVTDRICDRLVNTFDPKSVFRDIQNIPPGADFLSRISAEIDQSDVMLVVIGKIWLSITDDTGERRLNDPNDPVRIEVERGLARQKAGRMTVIPVLVNDAVMPKASDLPRSLGVLSSLNASTVRNDPDFHRDMDRLIGQLRTSEPARVPPSRVARRRRARRDVPKGWLLGGISLLAVVVLIGLVWAVLALNNRGDQDPVPDATIQMQTEAAETALALAQTATAAPTATLTSRVPVADIANVEQKSDRLIVNVRTDNKDLIDHYLFDILYPESRRVFKSFRGNPASGDAYAILLTSIPYGEYVLRLRAIDVNDHVLYESEDEVRAFGSTLTPTHTSRPSNTPTSTREPTHTPTLKPFTPTPTPMICCGVIHITGVQSAYVREEPSTSAEIVGTLDNATWVDVVKQQQVADYIWYQIVSTEKNVQGWVREDLIYVDKPEVLAPTATAVANYRPMRLVQASLQPYGTWTDQFGTHTGCRLDLLIYIDGTNDVYGGGLAVGHAAYSDFLPIQKFTAGPEPNRFTVTLGGRGVQHYVYLSQGERVLSNTLWPTCEG